MVEEGGGAREPINLSKLSAEGERKAKIPPGGSVDQGNTKTLYTVTDGTRSSHLAEISEAAPTKTKMSRSQLEQRSVMQLKNEVLGNSTVEMPPPE